MQETSNAFSGTAIPLKRPVFGRKRVVLLVAVGVLVAVTAAVSGYFILNRRHKDDSEQQSDHVEDEADGESEIPLAEEISSSDLDDYEWTADSLKEEYASLSWNKVTASRIDSLIPSSRFIHKFSEKVVEDCTYQGEFLRKEGCLCQRAYYLEVEEGDYVATIKKVQTFEEVKERFAPVESEAEAAAFVGIRVSDLKIDDNDVLEGYTATVDDGYLVQVFTKNTCGCGCHIPTGETYKVTKDGDIERIAFEEEKDCSDDEKMCVD